MPTYRFGTQSWTYFPDWQGSFYPPDMPTAEALGFYARVFDSVEVNATFHSIPSASTVRGWAERTGEGFLFALKLPRAISHDLRLARPHCEPLLETFLERANLLEGKLGPILVQLPPSFDRSPDNRRALAAFLDLLPAERYQVALEVRHSSWVDEAVERALAERNVAWTLAEWGQNGRVLLYPADFTYVRWVRSSGLFSNWSEIQVDQSESLDWWAQALATVPAHVKTAYCYMSNEFAGFAPASLQQLQQRLGHLTVDVRSLWPQRPLL